MDQDWALEISAESKSVTIGSGARISHDFLIVAPGLDYTFHLASTQRPTWTISVLVGRFRTDEWIRGSLDTSSTSFDRAARLRESR